MNAPDINITVAKLGPDNLLLVSASAATLDKITKKELLASLDVICKVHKCSYLLTPFSIQCAALTKGDAEKFANNILAKIK